MCLVCVFLMIKKADNILNNKFLIPFLSLLYPFSSVFIPFSSVFPQSRKKLSSKLISGSSTVKTEFNFYYRCAIQIICSLFKITAEHVSKNIFQTGVFEQPFSNSSILNSVTKNIVSNFEH